MKTIKLKIMMVCLYSLPIVSNAQLGFIGPNAGRTVPPIAKIGIGNFPTVPSINAKLHVNSFLLAPNPATNGFLFRTDGDQSEVNQWQLYTGATNTTSTEKFRLYIPSNTGNAVLETSQANSQMQFNTNGAINRLLIVDGGTASAAGRIAMGNNLPNNFVPQSRLHLYQTDGFNNLRFTTDGTGHGTNDGFQIGIGSTGDVAFINNELNQNFSWYNQGGGAPGTLLGRMRLYDGGVGQTTGRLLIGNDLPFVFIPLDRLHLYENANSGFNAIRFQNLLTGTTVNDGYRTGISNTNKDVLHTQFENRPIRWELPTTDLTGLKEWMRIQHGGVTYHSNTTDGYIGLNNDTVMFHIDGRTPAANGAGELFLSFRPTDADSCRMGMLNATGTNNRFLPTVFGNVNESQPWSGLQTIAAIHTAQDISANLIPVQRFIVGKNWVYNTTPLAPLDKDIDSISERNAFSWQNGGNVNMLMDAFGKLRIGATINLATPLTNRVIITSAINDPGQGSVATLGGSSGLQFTNLRAISPTTTNPGTGVLAVDSLGNVIYVPSTGIGNYCGLPQNSLTANYEIAMDDFSLYMHGIRNKVFVGDQTCNAASDSRFTVDNNSFSSGSQIAIKGISTGNAGSVGGRFEGARYGVFSLSSGGFAFGSGVLGQSQSATTTNIGGDFSGANGVTAIGVRGTSFGGASFNYGVYGSAPFSNNGSSTAFPTNAAVYAQGDLVATGTSYFAQQQQVSDQMFKTNVVSVTNALVIIDQLNPVSYEYLNNFGDRINFKSGTHYGFIAQEVEQIIPELVSEGHLAPVLDSNGIEITPALQFKSMDYNGLFSLLTQGIKEQQHIIHTQDSVITDLNTRLTTLENCLSGILPFLCQLSNSSIQQNDEQTQQNIIKELKVKLNNIQSIVLGQNVPNPFAEQTVIEYYIPEAVKQAQIIFYNQTGQIINTLNIEEMGNGRLRVFANDLSSGIYTYTLVADGQVIATKKMVKTK